ncbi:MULTISPECIES: hypothetical protein [Tenacibaculum]|uniref:Uncharacterized protein n=1 Tax=Tenacibaculum finnmarkense genomovar ulcerans TaxID=2781388 RepID=A0A2I2M8R4_9FLAO|nr:MULTISPECIES: hypothetical protein [Tenacibaculum]SOU86817.1 hypothetical protein TDCHD05_280007 [Tenacibaculum dicentrarchi]MBE7685800.1 hypothetical protein [Tenacibaculum piscium]MBE7696881.1 hypothetical protein [Tenacibaculum finnmarkense genomovar ulcerans]MCG8206156.1 hypothetical protein [Tenacibaculum finnmarkense genomovar finnmarkense]MCG8743023.1 hypothetical protein [Tenacibaculum finnmarkense]
MSEKKTSQAVTEVNVQTLKNNSYLLDGFTATENSNGNHLAVNLEFWHYENLGHNIGSLLNAISTPDLETENRLDANDIQNVALMTKQLVEKIPFQFLDDLLIKKTHNKENFKNIENL